MNNILRCNFLPERKNDKDLTIREREEGIWRWEGVRVEERYEVRVDGGVIVGEEDGFELKKKRKRLI